MSRLALLHTESSLGWGGQEIRVLTEARGVAARGHEVLLAAPPESRIYAEASRFGVDVAALPIGKKRPEGVAALRTLLRERRFDVANTHSSTDSWLTSLACRLASTPPAIVRTRHISAPVPRNFATRWLYRTAAAKIVTTGERLRGQVVEETGVPPERVVSIPTGIDLGRFSPGERRDARAALSLSQKAPLVGIVATLRSWKGHRYLIEALASLPGDATQLVIVGDGPQREALETLVAERRLRSRVRFAGNQVDVVPWMRALDVFCLPSYANEGVPQALMQAMACGCAVVTTPVGSITEIVEDGVTGLIVPPENPQRLAQALQELLGDETRRQSLGARAHALARERFGEERMVDRMIEVFNSVARHG
jgi:glycosyltransferase involved in cell wall biosynthesis